jgi:hypothetical protein
LQHLQKQQEGSALEDLRVRPVDHHHFKPSAVLLMAQLLACNSGNTQSLLLIASPHLHVLPVDDWYLSPLRQTLLNALHDSISLAPKQEHKKTTREVTHLVTMG